MHTQSLVIIPSLSYPPYHHQKSYTHRLRLFKGELDFKVSLYFYRAARVYQRCIVVISEVGLK